MYIHQWKVIDVRKKDHVDWVIPLKEIVSFFFLQFYHLLGWSYFVDSQKATQLNF